MDKVVQMKLDYLEIRKERDMIKAGFELIDKMLEKATTDERREYLLKVEKALIELGKENNRKIVEWLNLKRN
jgi:altronate dehydratase